MANFATVKYYLERYQVRKRKHTQGVYITSLSSPVAIYKSTPVSHILVKLPFLSERI